MCKLQWTYSDYKFQNSSLKISNCSVRLQIHINVPFFVHEIPYFLIFFSVPLKYSGTGDFKV
jgi:hypothetical protein